LGQVQHEECADPVRANEGDGGVPAQGGRDLRSNLWVRSKRLRKNRLNWGGEAHYNAVSCTSRSCSNGDCR
jgi:hypothetical protein